LPEAKKFDLSDKSLYDVHELILDLYFEDSGYDRKVYASPNTENAIYTIQKGDKVKVTRFVNVLKLTKVL